MKMGRIDWEMASAWLVFLWIFSLMSNTYVVAIAWTSIIIIIDLVSLVINKIIKKRVKKND